MINFLWAFMILGGIAYGAVTGNIAAVGNGALDAAGEAVQLCITMAGIMGLWCGVMEIASACGLIEWLTEKLKPVLYWLFPEIPRGHKAMEHISMNMIANILGLGWAATPAGLKAMEELGKLEEERCTRSGTPYGSASDEMCTFLIINISSLQLIPVNIIAYRSQFGSVNPSAVVGPALLATICSTAAAVIFCKLMCRKGAKS
jgi:spore maturation protein A